MKLSLKPVTRKDYQFLYRLLKKRKPEESISHKRMPSYEEHLIFCESKPYKEWKVVYEGRKKIGSIYLTWLNEIGFHLVSSKDSIIDFLFSSYAGIARYANVSPRNTMLIRKLKSLGYKLIQHTYEKENIR
jgi:hypothetical protein